MDISGNLQALLALLLGNKPWYPLNRKVGGPQSQSEYFDEQKKLLILEGIEP
jgi:hypothetical protein